MEDFSGKYAIKKNVETNLNKLKMEYNAEFQIILYTAMGRIVCDLEPPAEEGSLVSFTDDPTIFSIDISAMFDQKELFSANLVNAKNAVIYSNDTGLEIMRTEQILLFMDQIIGFSLIRRD